MSCSCKPASKKPCSIHLPVAPRANARRRFGEAENPGRALGPADVLQWVERVLADGVSLSNVVVTGPGEPLADPAPVLETIGALHEKHPDLSISLVTNGLCAPDASIGELAASLAGAGLARVSVLVDAVDPLVVEQVYAWIRPGRRTVPLPQASAQLVDAQAQAIRAFREAGLFVSVRMTVYPGINDAHVEDVASVVATLGADIFTLAAYEPVAPTTPAPAPESGCSPSACASCGSSKSCGSAPSAPAPAEQPEEAEALPQLAPGRLEELRAQAARYIAQTPTEDSCGDDILWMERAGAAGVLDAASPAMPQPSGARVNVAVASSDGMDVDLHLGQAIKFLIFGPRAQDGLPSLLSVREAPEPGGGDKRWLDLAETLGDCFAILAASAGAHPREVLAAQGITVLTAETDIKSAVDVLFGGGKRPGKKRIKAD